MFFHIPFSYFLFIHLFVINFGGVLRTKREIENSALEYLKKYGYLSKQLDFSLTRDSHEEIQRNALKRFQSFMGIEQTGELDAKTQEIMSLPRCGHPDIDDNTRRAEMSISSSYRQLNTSTNGLFYRWEKFNLTYAFMTYTGDLPRHHIHHAIRRAFNIWSEVSPFDFTQITDPSQADIKIGWFSREHECPLETFDDGGAPFNNVFAHAPPKGNLHFDDYENWAYLNPDAFAKNHIDLLYIAVHEIGHVIGLKHLEESHSIMHSKYKLLTDSKGNYVIPRLTDKDIEWLRYFYEPRKTYIIEEPTSGTCKPIPKEPLATASTIFPAPIDGQPVLYKRFTAYELKEKIKPEHNFLDPTETEKALKWTEQALFLFTSADKTQRNRTGICHYLKDKFNSGFGEHWNVIMGQQNSFYSVVKHAYQRYMLIKLDQNEVIEIYKIYVDIKSCFLFKK